MRLILGIDPGSVRMGYAILPMNGGKPTLGVLKLGAGLDLSQRAAAVYARVERLIEEHGISQVALEKVFYAKDVRALSRLAHCRGAAMAAAAIHGLPVYEYSALQIKKAVVGYGRASKAQVSWMVKRLFSLESEPSSDEADALAVAFCHLSHCKRDT